MEDVTVALDRKHVRGQGHRRARQTLVTRAGESRRAGWYPRIVRADQIENVATRYAHSQSRALLAASPSLPESLAPRPDMIALRRAREAQAFSAYAHAHSREQYELLDYQRAAHWQRLAADATRGGIMYRELGRMLLSAGRD